MARWHGKMAWQDGLTDFSPGFVMVIERHCHPQVFCTLRFFTRLLLARNLIDSRIVLCTASLLCVVLVASGSQISVNLSHFVTSSLDPALSWNSQLELLISPPKLTPQLMLEIHLQAHLEGKIFRRKACRVGEMEKFREI